jgi:hypothetical protein
VKQYVPMLFASSALVLAACGGGGSGAPGGGPPPTISPTATPSPTPTPGTTVAQGTLVDDPSGTPLPGVPVQLDPWTAYPTPGPTPTPILTTTTDASGHFTISAKNGTYLLVIGSDAVNTPPPGWSTPAPNATDTPIPGASGWRPTIHDRIVLTGGGSASSPITLVAPTMPPQPLYAPPAVETSSSYRLTTLDSLTEVPCLLAWNQLRAASRLQPAVLDEWLTENTRAIAWIGYQPNSTGLKIYPITSGGIDPSGGNNCADTVIGGAYADSALKPWFSNPQALWFAGQYLPTNPAVHSGFGAAEFPIDLRVFPDPNGLIWP